VLPNGAFVGPAKSRQIFTTLCRPPEQGEARRDFVMSGIVQTASIRVAERSPHQEDVKLEHVPANPNR